MIKTKDVLAEPNGADAVVACAITDYSIDIDGRIIGIAKQEPYFCRLISHGSDSTITISVPERGFAVSLLVEELEKFLSCLHK